MQYYSTNHHSPKVSLKDAMIHSEAADGGLYMPEFLPVLPKAFINNIAGMSVPDLSYILSNAFLSGELTPAELKQMADEVFSFPMPVYEIEPGIFVMELFHGPTLTVKDISARYLSRCFKSLHYTDDSPLNVLITTTGNSGNAIANVLHHEPGVNVFVLYPKGLQRSQMDQINSYGDNIHAVEINGHPENCVSMTWRAFHDPDLSDFKFVSANSYNIVSLMAYITIYFSAYGQLRKKKERPGDVYFSVPTGCAGNLLAAYMAKYMGLPISGLIGACNSNAGFKHCLERGMECVRDLSERTLSYAMDMPRATNMPRFLELCKGDINQLRRDIKAEVATDPEIADTINEVYARTGYLLDPHAAVAYICLKKQLPKGATGLFFATSHPSRSLDVLTKINKGGLKLPPSIKVNNNFCLRPEAKIPPTYGALKKYLKYYAEPSLLQNRV